MHCYRWITCNTIGINRTVSGNGHSYVHLTQLMFFVCSFMTFTAFCLLCPLNDHTLTDSTKQFHNNWGINRLFAPITMTGATALGPFAVYCDLGNPVWKAGKLAISPQGTPPENDAPRQAKQLNCSATCLRTHSTGMPMGTWNLHQ